MKTLIHNALIINEGHSFLGALLVDGEQIVSLFQSGDTLPEADIQVNAQGAYLMPGVIDSHVHFREPGLSRKGDTASESRAALAGGVTSVMDMPNVSPQTTSNTLWQERMDIGEREMRVNYAYYLGATNDNLAEIKNVDCNRVPAIKLFMGSSTGGMLVEKETTLRAIFRHSPLPIMTHCEDTSCIVERMKEAQKLWGDDPHVRFHPWIRSREACLLSSESAVRLAREKGAKLHIAHVSTEEELQLAGENVSTEACVGHLIFSEEDYERLGTRIKVNPSIKSLQDREALRQALSDGRITTIATDHAPHLIEEKVGGARQAASGMPMVQFSLPCMLDLVQEGVLSIERMVELMCHAPATLYQVKNRGFIRPGYQADLVLVAPEPWTLTKADILSKCAWSPLEGHTFRHRVLQTYVNGCLAYDHGHVNDEVRGQALWFNR